MCIIRTPKSDLGLSPGWKSIQKSAASIVQKGALQLQWRTCATKIPVVNGQYPPTFHYTGSLIGLPLMVYEIIPI